MAIMRKNITILIVFALVFSVTSKLFAQEAEWNKWVAPKSANDMRNPFKGNPSATAQGKKMFRGMLCVMPRNERRR
ncbi:MAG: hypothetical protein GXO84_01070 [Chlorobi bacterium]|nr:hypothetical protein [Chlorobiota bacterium]